MRCVRACSLCLRRFDGGPSPRPRPVSDARHATHGTSCLLPARSPPGGPSAISRTQHRTVSVPCLASSSGPGFVSFRSPLAGGRAGKRHGRDDDHALRRFSSSLFMHSKSPSFEKPKPGRHAAARLARHVVNSFTHSDVIAWGAAAAQAREAGEGKATTEVG